MRSLTATVFAFCLGIAGAAYGADDDDVTAESFSDESREIVCEKITRVGTRIPERVCRTRASIEAERAAARKWTRDRQRRGTRASSVPDDG